MTVPYNGGARNAGPLGFSSGGIGGRVPGPIGRTLWQKQSPAPAGATVTKAMTFTVMPPPSKTSTVMEARLVSWDLFKGEPATTDVRQGELATCPIAAILAALAHTAWGQKHIKGMIQEHKTTAGVRTTLAADVVKELARKLDDDPDYRKPSSKILSDRYFTVTLGGKLIDVSDVFYTTYTDGTSLNPIYMQARPPASPEKAREALWPAVIEKAYAAQVGSYEKLDDYGPTGTTLDVYWTTILGLRPQTIAMTDATALSTISSAAAKASQSPTVGASKKTAKKVSDTHGFAVMGIQGSQVELYDPWGKTVKISLDDFRGNFDLILQKP